MIIIGNHCTMTVARSILHSIHHLPLLDSYSIKIGRFGDHRKLSRQKLIGHLLMLCIWHDRKFYCPRKFFVCWKSKVVRYLSPNFFSRSKSPSWFSGQQVWHFAIETSNFHISKLQYFHQRCKIVQLITRAASLLLWNVRQVQSPSNIHLLR